jgi:hypothetical protein
MYPLYIHGVAGKMSANFSSALKWSPGTVPGVGGQIRRSKDQSGPNQSIEIIAQLYRTCTENRASLADKDFSTTEQANTNYSLPTQEAKFKHFCTENTLPVAETFVDLESARTNDRPHERQGALHR